MSAISKGRIVTKIMGREAGRKAVVTQIIDQNFAEITGPFELTGVKRRRVNISHIEPTEFEIKFKKDNTSDSDTLELIESDAKLKKFMLTKLS
ncbi:MAG: 50S ribosomal protein L14e [Candidatus Kariarchaeaceae archaeon]|jgi:large subunit ribosomal protein L14e